MNDEFISTCMTAYNEAYDFGFLFGAISMLMTVGFLYGGFRGYLWMRVK